MKLGEIIQLGRHRVMCGDATIREDVFALKGSDIVRLVLTDPPYGIRVVDRRHGTIGNGSQRYAECIGDSDTHMFRDSWHILRTISNSHIIWGGQNFADFLPVSCGWLWWDKCKNNPALSFGDGELAWSNISTRNRKYIHRWNGNIRDGNPALNHKIHPNQKPVELFMKILEDFSKPDDVILDCFGGSGTTLIACELTGRKCLMMEISPEYCDIICERYERIKAEFPIGYPASE